MAKADHLAEMKSSENSIAYIRSFGCLYQWQSLTKV